VVTEGADTTFTIGRQTFGLGPRRGGFIRVLNRFLEPFLAFLDAPFLLTLDPDFTPA